jgi:hypothetical protein
MREFSWQGLKDTGQLVPGEIVAGTSPAPVEQLRVENTNGIPSWVTLIKIARPAVNPPAYAITGEIRTEGIEGTAYLEMRSRFSDDHAVSVETLGSGLMKPLQGTHHWRPFALPLRLDEGAEGPIEVVLELSLPSRGTVYLGSVRLVQYREVPQWLANPNGLDSTQIAWVIWLSLIVVTLLGCQIVASVYAIRRGGRCRVVGWLAGIGQLLGGGLLASGAFGLWRGSPPLMSIALLVLGALYLCAMWGLMPSIHKRRSLFDLEQLSAMDAWNG